MFGGAQLSLTRPPERVLARGRDGALSRVRDGDVGSDTGLHGPHSPCWLLARTRNSYIARVRSPAFVQHDVLSSSLAFESSQRASLASRHCKWNRHAPSGASQSTAMLNALAAAAIGWHGSASEVIERASCVISTSRQAVRRLSEIRSTASEFAGVWGWVNASSSRSFNVLTATFALARRACMPSCSGDNATKRQLFGSDDTSVLMLSKLSCNGSGSSALRSSSPASGSSTWLASSSILLNSSACFCDEAYASTCSLIFFSRCSSNGL
mmetsp:Transcript_5539/g.18361  ORF Transcript_5539/g.18361 Transcript_5539/m.18361 type:complete len:268 (+) Transcript_5539:676-1479(+)